MATRLLTKTAVFTLVIPNNTKPSNVVNTGGGKGFILFSPATLTGTVAPAAAPSASGTLVPLSEAISGVVSATAGDATYYSGPVPLYLGVVSSSNEGADRTFTVHVYY